MSSLSSSSLSVPSQIEGNLARQNFREAVAKSQHIIVVAGAGLSAASGIPTFRDGGGIWRSLDSTSLATPSAFVLNPSLVWQFYHYRRAKALQTQPNAAHKLLAKLSVPKYLKTVAPAAKTFHLITQNVDGLSVAALRSLAGEFPNTQARLDRVRMDSVLPMHGSLFDVECTKCGHTVEDLSNPLCPSLGVADLQLNDYVDAGSKEISIAEGDLPRCELCGALARPGVVWFDEKPYKFDEINSLVYKADMCLVIGTSSTVRPASTYAYRVQRRGGKVAVFNLEPSVGDDRADFIFRGPCEVQLPLVFPELSTSSESHEFVSANSNHLKWASSEYFQ